VAQYTTTYDNLTGLLDDFTVDNSTEFQNAVQGIVNRAEERCLRDLDLSLFNKSVQTTTQAASQTITKSVMESPVHAILFPVQGDQAYPYSLRRRSKEYIDMYGGSGAPLYYYDDQTLIYFAPTPDQAYTISITQIQNPARLTSSNQTNWLALNAADLLLWAALIESEAFLIAPERVAEFTKNYASCLGPLRGRWRELAQTNYDDQPPTPAPEKTR
jgi:hypothetical protein